MHPQEVLKDLHAVGGMNYLRVKLHAVESFLRIFHSGYRNAVGMGRDLKSFRDRPHRILMAHPYNLIKRNIFKQTVACINNQVRFSVFPVAGTRYFTAQRVGHKLHAVAYAENGHAEFKKRGIGRRRVISVDACRATRKYQSARILGLKFFN